MAFGTLLSTVVLVCLVSILVACSDDDQAPKSETPFELPASNTGRPTTANACPAPHDVCDKAAALQKAILFAKDFDWVVQNYPPLGFIVCKDSSGYFGPASAALCQGAGPNEARFVYTIAPNEAPMSAEDYKDALRDWAESASASDSDQYGPAANRLYSVGCKEAPGRPACSDGFILVFSKLPAGAADRSQLIFFIEPREDGRVSTFIGPMPDPAHLDPALRGGTADGFFGPAGRSTTFYSLK